MRRPESLGLSRARAAGWGDVGPPPSMPGDPSSPPAALAGTSIDVLVQVAVLLGLRPNPPVVLIDEDAHLGQELHLPLVQLVRAYLRHRRLASAPPREPGSGGPRVGGRTRRLPRAGSWAALTAPRAAHAAQTPGFWLLGWVRLRDAIRKRSARPSARKARTPASLPGSHRLLCTSRARRPLKAASLGESPSGPAPRQGPRLRP